MVDLKDFDYWTKPIEERVILPIEVYKDHKIYVTERHDLLGKPQGDYCATAEITLSPIEIQRKYGSINPAMITTTMSKEVAVELVKAEINRNIEVALKFKGKTKQINFEGEYWNKTKEERALEIVDYMPYRIYVFNHVSVNGVIGTKFQASASPMEQPFVNVTLPTSGVQGISSADEALIAILRKVEKDLQKFEFSDKNAGWTGTFPEGSF